MDKAQSHKIRILLLQLTNQVKALRDEVQTISSDLRTLQTQVQAEPVITNLNLANKPEEPRTARSNKLNRTLTGNTPDLVKARCRPYATTQPYAKPLAISSTPNSAMVTTTSTTTTSQTRTSTMALTANSPTHAQSQSQSQSQQTTFSLFSFSLAINVLSNPGNCHGHSHCHRPGEQYWAMGQPKQETFSLFNFALSPDNADAKKSKSAAEVGVESTKHEAMVKTRTRTVSSSAKTRTSSF